MPVLGDGARLGTDAFHNLANLWPLGRAVAAERPSNTDEQRFTGKDDEIGNTCGGARYYNDHARWLSVDLAFLPPNFFSAADLGREVLHKLAQLSDGQLKNVFGLTREDDSEKISDKFEEKCMQ